MQTAITLEGSLLCKHGCSANGMHRYANCSSITGDCSSTGQLDSRASSHSRNHVSLLASSVPAEAAFGKREVLIRSFSGLEQVASPLLSQQHCTVPFNNVGQGVQIDTPLFKGQVLVMFKGLPDTPSLFNGKKRLMWMIIQGQFKQPLGLDSLMLGSEFERSLKLPAGGLLSRVSTWLMQRMGSGVQLNTAGSNPHILAPLIAAAQVVNVARPGQQPSMLDAEEDMTLFDPNLVSSRTGKPLTAAKRRSHVSNKSYQQGHMYDTDNIWSFHLYDHVMDYSTFFLPIPLFSVDLVQVLDGQPMQLLLKDMDSNSAVLKLEVWHKRMLEHKANSSSSSSSGSCSNGSVNSSPEPVPAATHAGFHSRVSIDHGVISQTVGGLSRSGSLQAASVAGLIKA